MLLFFTENVSSSKKHRMREIVFLACIFTVKTVLPIIFSMKSAATKIFRLENQFTHHVAKTP